MYQQTVFEAALQLYCQDYTRVITYDNLCVEIGKKGRTHLHLLVTHKRLLTDVGWCYYFKLALQLWNAISFRQAEIHGSQGWRLESPED